jgi:hypothetical protein
LDAYGSKSAAGLKLSYQMLSTGDGISAATASVFRVFLAGDVSKPGISDQNGHKASFGKYTLGMGYENRHYFGSLYFSKGSGDTALIKDLGSVGNYLAAYDTGYGLRVGTYVEEALLRLTAGADYERGKYGARQVTGSLEAEKFFQGMPFSVALSGESLNRRDSLAGSSQDTRGMLTVKVDVTGQAMAGSHPDWAKRALATSAAHKRTVDTYAFQQSKAASPTTSNRAPVAVADSVTVVSGSSNNSIAVLANDSDADGDTLSISAVSAPSKGSASISGKNIVYNSNTGSSGTDSFTYTVSDGKGGSAQGTVTVTITAAAVANRAPVAVSDTATVAANAAATLINVLANDSDADGDTLSLTAVGATSAGGTATLSGNQISYTPKAGYSGTETFSYTVSDGKGGSAQGTVTVTITPAVVVNRVPVAVNDTATVAANAAATLINVLANDSDADGDTLSLTAVGATSAGGTATLSGNQISYTPKAGYSGTETFSYTVSDGKGGSAQGTVTVTITPAANRVPVAVNDTLTVAANSSNNVVNVLANDSDPDGDTLSIQSISTAPNGTVILVSGKLSYTPKAGYSGSDSFSYVVGDGKGGTATATVTITVTPAPSGVNVAPVAVNDSFTVSKDSSANLLDVLANDSDANGDTLAIIAINPPQKGTASIVGSKISYTPNAGFTGSDTITYLISDGRGGTAIAVATITVM